MFDSCPIAESIKNGTPAAIGKIGGTEGKALAVALNPYNRWLRRDRIKRRMHALYDLSGVFPETLESFNRFIKLYSAEILPQTDYLVHWRGADDIKLHKKLKLTAKWIDWDSLDSPAPWWRELKNKKILIVSPFQHTLAQQAARIEKIWPQGELPVRPQDISIYACPHYAHLVPPKHKDWFIALDDMTREIGRMDYDVMLIGAGAWSLPLAVFAKNQAKIGIHLGGMTQIMFGVVGGRWSEKPNEKLAINNSWTRPLEADTPSSIKTASEIFQNDAKYW